VGACLWIVGLSGTGKTTSTVIRVEERASEGHKFLGIDPHWFKDDSFTNAVTAYRDRFLLPIAQTPEENLLVLNTFLKEFYGRKGGTIPKPWQKITITIDEVNALMDATTPEEIEGKELLQKVARICGQEGRNFNMGGIFISQQATGLSWLRKVALMVIVHQLLQESEKRLATNNDASAMADMKNWPVGRTYVYGVGFQDGPITVQQPLFDGPVVESTVESVMESTPVKMESVSLKMASDMESNGQTAIDGVQRPGQRLDSTFPFDLEKFKHAQKLLVGQTNQNDIICEVWQVQENTRAFRTAKEEFRLMLAYLASIVEEVL
jgi:hypothetical protein